MFYLPPPDRRVVRLSLSCLSCLFVATLLPLPAFVTFPQWNGAPLTKASVDVAVVRLRVRHRRKHGRTHSF